MKKQIVSLLLCGSLAMTGFSVAAEGDITIGSVIMNNSGEWFAEVLKGQEDAAEDLGVNCIFTSSDNEISKESDNVAMLISKSVDALVISPLAVNASVKTIESASVTANIPVVTWNTTIDTEVVSHIGVDASLLGGNTGIYAAEYVEENMQEGCHLAIIGDSNYEIGIDRCDGFKSAIEDLVSEKKIEIVAEENAEFQKDSYSITCKILEEHPEVEMIWCWNQISLLGCVSAVKDAKRNDIILLGTDMSVELAEEMLEDDVILQAVTTQMPYEMGYRAIENAVKAVRGEELQKEVIIPVYTYQKEKPEEIRTYIAEHEALIN